GAGKTTNLQTLVRFFPSRRRGELITPNAAGTDAGGTGPDTSTEYFDWLQVEGGLVLGRPVRCQLVSTPGRADLSERRRVLLDAADAMVLIVESTTEGIARAREMMHEHPILRERLAVVQANQK